MRLHSARQVLNWAGCGVQLFTQVQGFEKLEAGGTSKSWEELESSLRALPLHLKASDQRGKVGVPIFDPVATNSWIKKDLLDKAGWAANVRGQDQSSQSVGDIRQGSRD